MHLALPDVLDRTRDYLARLQSIEGEDMVEVDPTVVDAVGEMAAEVRQELKGGLPLTFINRGTLSV